MSKSSNAVLSSAYISNLEVANNIRINNEALLTGELKTGENISSGTIGQHLISRGPDKSPEWSTTTPDYNLYDYVIIGGGESGITSFIHLVQKLKAADSKETVALISDGEQLTELEFRKGFITFPQNLPDNTDIKAELVRIGAEDHSQVSFSQGGYSLLNLGGKAYDNKLDNVYSENFVNYSTGTPTGLGGFDIAGAFYVYRQLGGYTSINGNNANVDETSYRVTDGTDGSFDYTTWTAPTSGKKYKTGLVKDNIDKELKEYENIYSDLMNRPITQDVIDSLDQSTWDSDTLPNVTIIANQTQKLEAFADGTITPWKSRKSKYAVSKNNFFVSGRRDWNKFITDETSTYKYATVIYNTNVDEIRDGTEEVKTLVANNGQFKILAKKIIIAGGQIGTTKLITKLIKDNSSLYPGGIPDMTWAEAAGHVAPLFIPNIKPEYRLNANVGFIQIPLGSEQHLPEATITGRTEALNSPTLENAFVITFNLDGVEAHMLRFIGFATRREYRTLEELFTLAHNGGIAPDPGTDAYMARVNIHTALLFLNGFARQEFADGTLTDDNGDFIEEHWNISKYPWLKWEDNLAISGQLIASGGTYGIAVGEGQRISTPSTATVAGGNLGEAHVNYTTDPAAYIVARDALTSHIKTFYFGSGGGGGGNDSDLITLGGEFGVAVKNYIMSRRATDEETILKTKGGNFGLTMAEQIMAQLDYEGNPTEEKLEAQTEAQYNFTTAETGLNGSLYLYFADKVLYVQSYVKPKGFISLNAAIIYNSAYLTALLANPKSTIDHDFSLSREFKLDPDTIWINSRPDPARQGISLGAGESSDARKFRLIKNLLPSTLNFEANNTNNTELDATDREEFEEQFVNDLKAAFKNNFVGTKSMRYNILNEFSSGGFSLINSGAGQPIGLVPTWISQTDPTKSDYILPNNAETLSVLWYTTFSPVDLNQSTKGFLANMKANTNVGWHGTQHLRNLANPVTNLLTKFNRIWGGDQCVYPNITVSSSAVLSSCMGIRSVNNAFETA